MTPWVNTACIHLHFHQIPFDIHNKCVEGFYSYGISISFISIVNFESIPRTAIKYESYIRSFRCKSPSNSHDGAVTGSHQKAVRRCRFPRRPNQDLWLLPWSNQEDRRMEAERQGAVRGAGMSRAGRMITFSAIWIEGSNPEPSTDTFLRAGAPAAFIQRLPSNPTSFVLSSYCYSPHTSFTSQQKSLRCRLACLKTFERLGRLFGSRH